MEEIVNRLKNQRCRESTRETYHRIWRRFNKFFIRLDARLKQLENRIILFTGHLIEDCKLQSSSVKSYVSTIKCVLAINGIKLNQDDFIVNSLTRACRVRNDRIITRLLIKKGMLHLILKELIMWTNKRNQPYLQKLYSAMFASAYYGLLRVGEIA